MKHKLAALLRTVTTAPIMAAVMLTLLWFLRRDFYSGATHYYCALLFLTILPLLAYPVSWTVPTVRKKGRDGQRKLAIVFSVLGYIAGVVFCLAARGTQPELLTYLTYLISGVAIALFSFVFHIKGSGHACGVSGPVTLLAMALGPIWLLGYLLLAAVFWASLELKRHTPAQLLIGSAIPIVTLAVLMLIMRVPLW